MPHKPSPEILRALVESAQDPLVYLDRDFNFVYVNRAYAETCRRPVEELIGRNHFALFPHAEHQALFAAVRERGEPATLREQPLLFPDQPARGVTYWDLSLSPDKDAAAKVEGLVLSLREVTATVRAYQRIKDGEERLRALSASLPELVWSTDKDGRRYEDRRSHEQTGQRPRTGTALEWEAAIHPDDRERAVAAWREAIRTETAYHCEYRMLRAEGVYRWLLARAFPLRDASGQVESWQGTCWDIDEIKQTERALKDAESRASRRAAELQTIVDVAPLPIWIAHDAEGKTITGNPAAARFLGVSPEANVSQRPGGNNPVPRRRYFVDNRELTPSELPLQRVVREGVPVEAMPMEIELPDGTRKLIVGSAAPFVDDEGRVLGGVAACVDLTPLRQATLALQKSEERYRSLFNSMTEGFALHELVRDEAGTPCGYRILDVNLAFERLTGLRREDVKGKLVAEVIPELESLWIERCGKVTLPSEPIRFTSHSSGLQRDYDVLAFCPSPGQFATIFMDVTEQLRAQAALQEADRRKTEFLAILSHELRNPLAPIRNSLYVLERTTPGSEPAQRAKAIIDRQVALLARLVDDLLDVTRISRGKIQLRRSHFDLLAVVQRTVDDHRNSFAKGGIEIAVHTPQRELPVYADQTRLAQVIGNLLHNALKFTPKGGCVTVRCQADEAQRQAVLSVRDTGIGMTKEVLAHLFEPFMQAPLGLDRGGGGLGLGLSLVRGFVEMHSGEVTAHSDGPDKGAEFVVRLPLTSPDGGTIC